MKAGECVGFKKKQYMGLGLTIFFLFLLLSIILVMMNSIKANMLEIVEDRYYKVNETTTIRQELYKKDRDLILLITEGVKEDVLDPNVSASDEKDINEIILNLETKLNRNKSKVLINEVKQSYQQYAVMETEIKNQLADGAGRAELQAIYNENLAARDVLFSKIDEFKNFQESLMNSALKEATATYDGLVEALVVLVSLAILIIAGVILWVIRGTVGTINSITSVIKRVDYKDLSVIPRIQVKTKDEFGEIAQAYNTMAASIEELTKKEKIYSEEIEEQNWIESHSVEIVKLYSKHVTVAALAEQFIQKLTPLMGGSH
jgi:two-component system, chemotaxis family, sensor kinase CheA